MARSEPKWRNLETQRDHPDVRAYLARLDPPTQRLARDLRELVRNEAPDVLEAIYWRTPFFFAPAPFAYISATKAHVILGFPGGARLEDPDGVLDGTGRSNVRRMRMKPGQRLPTASIQSLIHAAYMSAAPDRDGPWSSDTNDYHVR